MNDSARQELFAAITKQTAQAVESGTLPAPVLKICSKIKQELMKPEPEAWLVEELEHRLDDACLDSDLEFLLVRQSRFCIPS